MSSHMMGIRRPRRGMLSLAIPENFQGNATRFPFGMTQGNSEGTTLPESARLESAQLVGEVSATDGTGRTNLDIWKNSTGTAVFATANLFFGSLGWRRAIDTTPTSAANALILGEDTTTPDKILGRINNQQNTTGIFKWATATVHHRYLLDDYSSIGGSVGFRRVRWVTPAVWRVQHLSDASVSPYGGTFDGTSEGTTPPTSVRWRRAQLVCWTSVAGTGPSDRLAWGVLKNVDAPSNLMFVPLVFVTTTGMKRAATTAVQVAGTDLFAGEDAAAPDELLSTCLQEATGALSRDISMTLHGALIP